MASYNYDWLHTAQAQYNPPVYTTPAPGSDYSTLIGAVGDPQPHEMIIANAHTYPSGHDMLHLQRIESIDQSLVYSTTLDTSLSIENHSNQPRPSSPPSKDIVSSVLFSPFAINLLTPVNYVCVPQQAYRDIDPPDSTFVDPHFRCLPIIFQAKDSQEGGVKVSRVLDRWSPALVGGNDLIMGETALREFKMKIWWPGYDDHPYEKRQKTHGGKICRDTLLLVIANFFTEFSNNVIKKDIPCQPGYESWRIVKTTQDAAGTGGISASEVIITALVHRGGSVWQPEFWVPQLGVGNMPHVSAGRRLEAESEFGSWDMTSLLHS